MYREPPEYELTARSVWRVAVKHAGTGSPRLVDIDGDGIRDILIGRGAEGVDGGVVAINGASGRILWDRELGEQIYAKPTLIDIDSDGAIDLVVGGRHHDLTALRGRDGAVLWSMRRANPEAGIPERNIHGAVSTRDADGDSVPDLLVTQSGQYDDATRIVGRLYLVSGASGKIIRVLEMPDGREVYGLPVIVGEDAILGTGGETLPGHLFGISLPDLRMERRLASRDKGFIGSPFVTAGRHAVTNAFDGTVSLVDLRAGKPVWERRFGGYETYVSPAPGRFDPAGSRLDVVTVLSRGTYPVYKDHAVVAWVDGDTGRVIASRRLGVMTAASPIVVDLNADGFDETIVLSNHGFDRDPTTIASSLVVFDGRAAKRQMLRRRVTGLSHVTPHITDIGGDGKLDLIHVYWGWVERLELSGDVSHSRPGKVRWGQLRGPSAQPHVPPS